MYNFKVFAGFVLVVSSTCGANAAIVHDLNMGAGAQAVDATTTTYLDWGYSTSRLLDGDLWDNQKAGFTPDLVLSQSGYGSGADRDYGHTFTFSDGTAPTSDTTAATNGNLTVLNSSNTFTLSFDGIVSSSERTLTLYMGTYGAGGSATLHWQSTLTGGTLDESTGVESTGTAADITPGTYTVTFSSLTETDLDIEVTISNTGGGGRNFGISGYTLTGEVNEAPLVPEPSSILLGSIGIFSIGMLVRRRRRM